MNEEGKENYCLLRMGIDKNPQTSFLSCIAAIYEDIVGNTFNNVDNGTKLKNIKKSQIEKIRRLITTNKILSITLDQFITLHNGSLIDIFSSNNYNDENINRYKDQKIYKKSKGKKNWKTYGSSAKNFSYYENNSTKFIVKKNTFLFANTHALHRRGDSKPNMERNTVHFYTRESPFKIFFN